MKNELVELTMPFPKWCGTLKSEQKWGSYGKNNEIQIYSGKKIAK